jgi:hypothetical protein
VRSAKAARKLLTSSLSAGVVLLPQLLLLLLFKCSSAAVQVLNAKAVGKLLTSSLSAGVGAGVLGLFLAALSYAEEASFFRPAARLAKSPAK